MATQFSTASEFKIEFDKYNAAYPEKNEHATKSKQYLAGHTIPLDLNYDDDDSHLTEYGVTYIPEEERGSSGLNDRYSLALDTFTQAISKTWAEDVMKGYSPEMGEEGSEFWHQLAIYRVRRGYGLLQQAAYRIAANHSFHIINASKPVDITPSYNNPSSLHLPYQEYFDADNRGGCDGHDFAYSALMDAILRCDIPIYEDMVFHLIKEGVYTIATGD